LRSSSIGTIWISSAGHTKYAKVVEDGYEFMADRKLVTVFSAPNYCGEFDNAGGMMTVSEDLLCSFQILRPSESKRKRK